MNIKLKKKILAGVLSGIALLSTSCRAVTPLDNASTTSDKDNYYDLIETGSYLKEDEIKELSEKLGCNLDLMTIKQPQIHRITHNNGKPILVAFDESFSEESKQLAIKSLDYVFGLVNQINDQYNYKVIDNFDNLENSQNSRIYYTDMSEDIKFTNSSASGTTKAGAYTNFDRTHIDDNGSFNYQNTIMLNQEELKNFRPELYESNAFYFLTHELLHVFGFSDVYFQNSTNNWTNNIYDNTYMAISNFRSSNRNQFAYSNIFPNDFRCLVSAYAKAGSLNDPESLKKLQQLCDYYDEYFYSNYAKEESTQSELSDTYSMEYSTSVSSGNVHIHTISVDGDNYTITIQDLKTKEILETITGKVTYYNSNKNEHSIAILHNIESNYLYKDYAYSSTDKTITDLVITREENKYGQDNYYVNGLTNSIYFNRMLEIEPENTLEMS